MTKFKDVHTEHCCIKHGCKYGEEDCSVVTGCFQQSFLCEQCQYDDHIKSLDELKDIMNCENMKSKFKTGQQYTCNINSQHPFRKGFLEYFAGPNDSLAVLSNPFNKNDLFIVKLEELT